MKRWELQEIANHGGGSAVHADHKNEPFLLSKKLLERPMEARPAFQISVRIVIGGWKAMYRKYPCNAFLDEYIRGGELPSQKGALPFSPPVECFPPQQRHEASLSCIITAQEDARDINL
jgi:hypothetical protein